MGLQALGLMDENGGTNRNLDVRINQVSIMMLKCHLGFIPHNCCGFCM